MKRYKAKRKGLIHLVLAGFLILPVAIFLLDTETFINTPVIMLPLVSPLALMVWIYVDTSYKIDSNSLIYRSGFLRGKIDIGEIKEILKGKTMLVGVKPALSSKGLIIKYNRYDEIYIGPEDNDELITDLLKLNPKIRIIDHHPESNS